MKNKDVTHENIEEIMMDISMNAGFLIAQDQIIIGDSRQFINSTVPMLAKEFVKLYPYNVSENYIEDIDTFSEIKLKEIFGIKE